MPGDILVLDCAGDTRHAACGGGVAYAAKVAGCIGIIIDGPATGIQELREYGLPVWGRGLSPVTGKRQHYQWRVLRARLMGVSVAPGDAILADEDGVLFLDRASIRADAERAISMQEDEARRQPRITAGERRPEPVQYRQSSGDTVHPALNRTPLSPNLAGVLDARPGCPARVVTDYREVV